MKLRTHVNFADTSDGAVLLHEGNGTYWQLNRSGAAALQVLLRGASVGDAAELLADRFDVELIQASADVGSLVAALQSAGLVTL